MRLEGYIEERRDLQADTQDLGLAVALWIAAHPGAVLTHVDGVPIRGFCPACEGIVLEGLDPVVIIADRPVHVRCMRGGTTG